MSHVRIDCKLYMISALTHVEFLCFVPSPPGAGTSTTECRLTGASMISSKYVDV